MSVTGYTINPLRAPSSHASLVENTNLDKSAPIYFKLDSPSQYKPGRTVMVCYNFWP